MSMGIKVLWKMRNLVLRGRLLFHTDLSFLYPNSANAALCLKAVLNGLFQLTMVPRYFTCVAVGTGLPSENEINGVALRGSTKSSVLVRLRCIPYFLAWSSNAVRMRCSCVVVKERSSVSSAYSKSYTGLATDQVVTG